jgi:hypothetical protein
MAKSEKDPMEKVEKMNDGSMSGLTKTIIGTVGTVVAAGGTFLISFMNGKKEDKAASPTINIVNPAQPTAQPATTTKTVVIKEKAAPSEKKEDKESKPKPKKDGDDFKGETKW